MLTPLQLSLLATLAVPGSSPRRRYRRR
eukprot:COSAG06_NODE_44485_length_363_cov_0.666667_2_plen_27_part_01